MIELAIVNNRKIFYEKYSTEVPWSKHLPSENWLAFVIADNLAKTKLREISNKLIEQNACYVCATGEQGELLHDIIDEEIVYRKVDPDYEFDYLPPFDIMTSWDNEIEEELWFAIYVANDDVINIDSIVCLDASESSGETHIRELLSRFNKGYVPD